jgi:hypothetical protein
MKVRLDGRSIGYYKTAQYSSREGTCEALFEGFGCTHPSTGNICYKAFKFGALTPAAGAATVEHPDQIKAGRIEVKCQEVIQLYAKVPNPRDREWAANNANKKLPEGELSVQLVADAVSKLQMQLLGVKPLQTLVSSCKSACSVAACNCDAFHCNCLYGNSHTVTGQDSSCWYPVVCAASLLLPLLCWPPAGKKWFLQPGLQAVEGSTMKQTDHGWSKHKYSVVRGTTFCDSN